MTELLVKMRFMLLKLSYMTELHALMFADDVSSVADTV